MKIIKSEIRVQIKGIFKRNFISNSLFLSLSVLKVLLKTRNLKPRILLYRNDQIILSAISNLSDHLELEVSVNKLLVLLVVDLLLTLSQIDVSAHGGEAN